MAEGPKTGPTQPPPPPPPEARMVTAKKTSRKPVSKK